MSTRFFIDVPPAAGRARLTGDEARHLVKVLRARVGDAIVVFDGSGHEWPARVVVVGRDTVDLEVGEPKSAILPRGVVLTVAAALPKGDRQKWMVEKLTELGVARMIPLETSRGVAEPTDGARARLERVVIETCKQCGRNTRMEIAPSRRLDALLADRPAAARFLIADPCGQPLDAASSAAAMEVIALVGPEGGFTDEEVATAERAGATRVSLGPHILRVETAAIAIAARLSTGPA